MLAISYDKATSSQLALNKISCRPHTSLGVASKIKCHLSLRSRGSIYIITLDQGTKKSFSRSKILITVASAATKLMEVTIPCKWNLQFDLKGLHNTSAIIVKQ